MYNIKIISYRKFYDIEVYTVGENINVFKLNTSSLLKSSIEDYRTIIEDLCYNLIEFYGIKNRHINGFGNASFMALNLIDKRLALGYKDSLDCQDSGVYFESSNTKT